MGRFGWSAGGLPRRWGRRAAGAGVLALVALGAGCGAGRPGVDSGQPAPAPVLVLVENHNWSDVVVHLVYDGTRVRLGLVPSMGRATLEVPLAVLGAPRDLQFLLDPVGSRETFLTEPFLVSEGQVVELTLENHLPLSRISVW